MKCVLCEKYQGDYSIPPIFEQDGITLSHITPSPDSPAMKARLLIEPIRHVTKPEELTSAEFATMGRILQKAMIVLQKTLGAEHVYFFRINDLVAHYHFHVVPRFPDTPKEFWGLKIIEWPDYPKLNLEEVQELNTKLQEAMRL
ncbi:MAG: HIT family protein [Bdellovibrionales bacterium]